MASEIRTILKTCSTCKQSFDTLRELIDHEKIHRQSVVSSIKNGQSSQLASEITNRYLEKRMNIEKGYAKAYEKGFFRCEYCDRTFLTRSGYQRHKRVFHVDASEASREKSCRVPETEHGRAKTKFSISHRKTVGQFSNLVSEVSNRLLEKCRIADRNHKKGFWPCDYCDKVYFSHDGDYKHQILVHGKLGGKSYSRQKSKRDSDTNVIDATKQCQEPTQFHKIINGVRCKYCLATFPKQDLHEHKIQFHTKGKRLVYLCSICPKGFRPYFSIEAELLMHATEKHPEIDVRCNIDKTKICSRSEKTADEFTASAWTTVVKTEPVDGDSYANDSGTIEFGTVKSEPLDQDQEYLESETKDEIEKEVIGHFSIANDNQRAQKMETRLRCKYCLATFAHRQSLLWHQKTLHGNNKRFMYLCSRCTYKRRRYFSNEKELLAHAAEKHPEVELKKRKLFLTSKTRGTESTTVSKDEDSDAMEVVNVKTESSADRRDEQGLGIETRGESDQTATTSGSAVSSTDVSVDDDDSHYFCQLVATSLRRLDRQTRTRVQADVKRILQVAADGHNWALIGSGDVS